MSDFPPSNAKCPGFVNFYSASQKAEICNSESFRKKQNLMHLCFEDDDILHSLETMKYKKDPSVFSVGGCDSVLLPASQPDMYLL